MQQATGLESVIQVESCKFQTISLLAASELVLENGTQGAVAPWNFGVYKNKPEIEIDDLSIPSEVSKFTSVRNMLDLPLKY